jgi:hypothetical protein
MNHKTTIGLAIDNELSTSTAHRRAMKILWVDILVTFAILAAVASRL